MNDLIRIVNTKISDAEIKTVNARELHVFLDSGQEFANWIKSRIAVYRRPAKTRGDRKSVV